jgi:hypothetical protein
LCLSADRDELRRLVEPLLSDDRVPAVLAEARRRSGQASVGELTAATSTPSDT